MEKDKAKYDPNEFTLPSKPPGEFNEAMLNLSVREHMQVTSTRSEPILSERALMDRRDRHDYRYEAMYLKESLKNSQQAVRNPNVNRKLSLPKGTDSYRGRFHGTQDALARHLLAKHAAQAKSAPDEPEEIHETPQDAHMTDHEDDEDIKSVISIESDHSSDNHIYQQYELRAQNGNLIAPIVMDNPMGTISATGLKLIEIWKVESDADILASFNPDDRAEDLLKRFYNQYRTYQLYRGAFLDILCVVEYIQKEIEEPKFEDLITFDNSFWAFRSEFCKVYAFEHYPSGETLKKTRIPPPYTRYSTSPIMVEPENTPHRLVNGPMMVDPTPRSYHSRIPKAVDSKGSPYPSVVSTPKAVPPVQFWGASNANREREERIKRGSGGLSAHDENEDEEKEGSQGSPPGPPPTSISEHSKERTRTPKPRSSLSEKVKWDGGYSSFHRYKKQILGHLHQSGASYLGVESFQTRYLRNERNGEMCYIYTQSFKETYGISVAQAEMDRNWLYGMLLSSNSHEGAETKNLTKHEATCDGILAWIDFLKDYNNNGSDDIRAQVLEERLKEPFTDKHPDGLLRYMDRFVATVNEIQVLLPESYNDATKFRLLYYNLEEAPGKIPMLLQTCKDRAYTFAESTEYIRRNGLTKADLADAPKRRIHKATRESSSMSYDDARTIYNTLAVEMGAVQAYNTLQRSPTMRENLKIPSKIWFKLSADIKEDIMKVRKEIEQETQSKKEAKPAPLPAQFNL